MKIANCSSKYGVWLVDGKIKVSPMHCHARACPICAEQRNIKLRERYRKALKSWTTPKHMSFTLKSSEQPLREQIERLVKCFHKLRKEDLWRTRNGYGIWTVEITKSKLTGLFHPHLHVIANISFIDKDALHAAWRKVTIDSWNCSIKAVRGPIENEMAKYIAKTSTIYAQGDDPYVLNAELNHRRFVQPFGKWPLIPKADFHFCVWVGTVYNVLK
ncbi:MAG: protein rep, partial [Candidatus Atribacteria bacterium]|nr:protein rep [Candidatus Atribacteria bacterium]